ncbi:MAG: FUSC family protein [Alphaproteobacteria bacterium]|nr:FUSC family protein [Alphaproteobacteria bacterium]
MTNASPQTTRSPLIQVLVFSIRCFVVVWGSYALALAVGLPYPVWAPISAVIVSQEQFTETRTTLIRRVIGTICGVAITVIINMLATPFGIGVGMQAALSVGICAILAYGRPNYRTAMVTGPILLLTTPPTDPMILVGIYRGTEVIIGGLVGGFVHVLAEKGLEYFKQTERKAQTPPKIAPEE